MGRSEREQYVGEGMRSLMEIPEDVNGSVPESCFMSLAKVMQCDWVLNREFNLFWPNVDRGSNQPQHLSWMIPGFCLTQHHPPSCYWSPPLELPCPWMVELLQGILSENVSYLGMGNVPEALIDGMLAQVLQVTWSASGQRIP